jgi:SAM-dependent methyltransferase
VKIRRGKRSAQAHAAQGLRALLDAVRSGPPASRLSARLLEGMEILAACPVCESPDIAQVFLPDGARCQACGIHFRNPRPTQDRIIQAYDAGETYASWQEQRPVRDGLWQRRLELVLRHVASGRLLDVGTGDGHFLDFARRRFDVTATDVSATAGDYARRRGHRILLGPVEAHGFPDGAFDAITLWHVLEHVPAPGRTLALAHRLLRPAGVLAVAVPNESWTLATHRLRSALDRDASWTPFGALRRGGEIHLTQFVPRTLEGAVRRAGFVPVESGVDDVHVTRSLAAVAGLRLQVLLHRVSGWHFARAMYLVGRKR